MDPGASDRACTRCQALAATLPTRGLGHWRLEDSADLHYWRTDSASQALEMRWNSPMVVALLAQLDAIHADRRVAWIDVQGSGAFRVAQAAHGMVPREL